MNRKEEKKFNYLYRTTNLINGKIYIGVHSTNRINDTYLGSGFILKRAIEKYGEKNFKKEILYLFDNIEEMYEKEKEIVNVDFVKRDDNYNMSIGGKLCILYGEKNGFYGKKHERETIEKMKLKLSDILTDQIYIRKDGKLTRIDADDYDKWEKDGWERSSTNGDKCWINKDGIVKMVRKDEAQNYICEGWKSGTNVNTIENKVWMNKDGKNKRIDKDIIDEHLKNGWKIGNCSTTTRDMICYNKDGINKMILPAQVEEYENNGWVKGMLKKEYIPSFKGKTHTDEVKAIISRKASENSKGRIWINKEEVTKMIYPYELEEYIKEGWKKGRK